MSYFREIFARQPRGPEPVWASYRSPEEFARDLMRAGTSTEDARVLMRQARLYFRQREADQRHREAIAEKRERVEYGIEAAAAHLLKETGYSTVEEYDSPGGTSGTYYAGHSEWLGVR